MTSNSIMEYYGIQYIYIPRHIPSQHIPKLKKESRLDSKTSLNKGQ